MAGMISAMLALKKKGLTPKATIHFAATIDEEVGFTGVRHLVASGFRADAGVVAEPTELKVIRAHKGSARWRIITHGKAAHSSKPHLGVNAIDKMADVILRLRNDLMPQLRHKRHPLVGEPTINLGLISGGAQINFVADTCTLDIDRRLIPGESTEDTRREILALLDALSARDPQFRATLAPPLLEDYAMETPENARIVQVASDACRQVMGQVAVEGVPYGTDASKLARVGISSIVFGPGTIDMAHGAVEYVEIDQVLSAAEIYAQIMLNF